MSRLRTLARRLARNGDGSMAIETAVVAPVLVMLAIGGFEVSTIVARQTELQSAAAESAAIVRAAIPETQSEFKTIKDVITASTGLANNQVDVSVVYRCGTNSDYVLTKDVCLSTTAYEFVRVRMTDSYSPLWTEFGLGTALSFQIERTVQIG
jgi:phage tail sheath gpL-like